MPCDMEDDIPKGVSSFLRRRLNYTMRMDGRNAAQRLVKISSLISMRRGKHTGSCVLVVTLALM
uniref:AlNc14C1959G13117 protein n=1 Tax=Albugo laibachii Nc14 TaxID=890382 RepID=F0X2V8_9STRA|nr:AlNc14C1959G13117 [Albugo laibachii Nc14]|eukprot:CCA28283.1 AlNc14C1959G13117 [Albugo laibachii Nc14]